MGRIRGLSLCWIGRDLPPWYFTFSLPGRDLDFGLIRCKVNELIHWLKWIEKWSEDSGQSGDAEEMRERCTSQEALRGLTVPS